MRYAWFLLPILMVAPLNDATSANRDLQVDDIVGCWAMPPAPFQDFFYEICFGRTGTLKFNVWRDDKKASAVGSYDLVASQIHIENMPVEGNSSGGNLQNTATPFTCKVAVDNGRRQMRTAACQITGIWVRKCPSTNNQPCYTTKEGTD